MGIILFIIVFDNWVPSPWIIPPTGPIKNRHTEKAIKTHQCVLCLPTYFLINCYLKLQCDVTLVPRLYYQQQISIYNLIIRLYIRPFLFATIRSKAQCQYNAHFNELYFISIYTLIYIIKCYHILICYMELVVSWHVNKKQKNPPSPPKGY